MAIVVTRDGQAERLSALGGDFGDRRLARSRLPRRPSAGNPVDHLKVLENKKKLEARGDPSLQNVLNMARSGLS
jgi:transcription initiation factor TFIIH subunit 2